MFTRRVFLMLIATAMMAVAVSAQSSDPNGKVLQGAWKVIITPEEGGPPPFPSLMTFTRDGGVIQTDAGPPAPGQPISLFSTGLGEWSKISKRQFIITYTQFQFDQGQNLIGLFRGRITAELDPQSNELTGTFTADFLDPDEKLIFSGQGTVKGTRLPVLGAD